ncbi:hypothetical protein PUN28_014501 [Cardiocondyla obscurior]|uniref:Uncharacterized protein n=1 Tax=Cardiocondyla obscurior TaxID=286306 RepID=A0AAW2F3M1_9HYME
MYIMASLLKNEHRGYADQRMDAVFEGRGKFESQIKKQIQAYFRSRPCVLLANIGSNRDLSLHSVYTGLELKKRLNFLPSTQRPTAWNGHEMSRESATTRAAGRKQNSNWNKEKSREYHNGNRKGIGATKLYQDKKVEAVHTIVTGKKRRDCHCSIKKKNFTASHRLMRHYSAASYRADLCAEGWLVTSHLRGGAGSGRASCISGATFNHQQNSSTPLVADCGTVVNENLKSFRSPSRDR